MIPFDKLMNIQPHCFEFGDKRLDKRCSLCFEQFYHCKSDKSFPAIFGDQYQLKGFYRLMNNKKVSPGKLVEGYRSNLEGHVLPGGALSGHDVFYQFQDTTYCKYNERNKLELGYMETLNDNGLVLHTGLLTGPRFTPLGVVYQKHIVRDRAEYGKGHLRKQRSFEEKESHKWAEAMDWSVGFMERTGKKVVHVMDREADILELFNHAAGQGLDFIVRARHDRKLGDGALFPHLAGLPADAVIERDILDEGGKPLRITCELCYGQVPLPGAEAPLHFVHIRQVDAPQGADPLKWTLLTTLVLEAEPQAVHALDIYTNRWRTCEDFHKCLKTGCRIEQRQFDSAHALGNAIALLSHVALKLLRMRHLSKMDKDADASQVLGSTEMQLATVLAERHLKPVDMEEARPGSVLWLTLLIARMGGHQGVRQKGAPGWQTLWKGWQYFQNLVDGFNLSKNFFNSS